MNRNALLFAPLLLAGCGGTEEPAAEPGEAPAPALGAQELPPQAADFPALASRECGDVVAFYLEALGANEWAKAALVWDDPVVDGARLEALLSGYASPRFAVSEPVIEGAAGSAYCTVAGTLTDAGEPARAPLEGALTLRRANDVPGATPEQLRWTLQSSTFVENLVRSARGQP
jgi:hypothetical protein